MPTNISPVPSALTLLLLISIAACRSERGDHVADSSRAVSVTGSTASADASHAVAGMPAMGGMHQDTLAPKVEAHLQRLSAAAPDSLRALVPVDRAVVTALIADCEQMMREMKMEPPPKWQRAVRDLRRDLDRMASMTGPQLQQAMRGHRQRIEAMLAMRRDMMKM